MIGSDANLRSGEWISFSNGVKNIRSVRILFKEFLFHIKTREHGSNLFSLARN